MEPEIKKLLECIEEKYWNDGYNVMTKDKFNTAIRETAQFAFKVGVNIER